MSPVPRVSTITSLRPVSAAACNVLIVPSPSSQTHKIGSAKRRPGIRKQIIRARIPSSLSRFFSPIQRAASRSSRLSRRPSNRPNYPIARRTIQRNKFTARVAQRKAVLVLASRGIRPQRLDPHSILNLRSRCPPLLRRSVARRRHPSLDVPTILRQILRHASQLDRLANQIPTRVVIRPPSTDPAQSRSAPHHTKIRLAVEIRSAGQLNAPLNLLRRLMRLPRHMNHRSRIRPHSQPTHTRPRKKGRPARSKPPSPPIRRNLVSRRNRQIVDVSSASRRVIPHLESRHEVEDVRRRDAA